MKKNRYILFIFLLPFLFDVLNVSKKEISSLSRNSPHGEIEQGSDSSFGVEERWLIIL